MMPAMGDEIRDLKEKAAKYAKKGQTRKAVQACEALLKHLPGDSRTLLRLGELWTKLGDKARATDYLVQAANGYLEEGFADRAVAVLRQALTVDPDQKSANELLVDALVAKHNEREAVRHLLSRAAAFEQAGQAGGQRAALKRAHELAPEDPDVNQQLAKLHAQAGKPEEAKESYQQALPALEKAGRTGELVEAVEKLRELGQDNLELQQKLAAGYLEQKEYDRAREVLKKAMVLKSDNLLTLKLVAQACLGQGDRQHALVTLKRMLRLARAKGNTEVAQEAQARLDEIRGK